MKSQPTAAPSAVISPGRPDHNVLNTGPASSWLQLRQHSCCSAAHVHKPFFMMKNAGTLWLPTGCQGLFYTLPVLVQ